MYQAKDSLGYIRFPLSLSSLVAATTRVLARIAGITGRLAASFLTAAALTCRHFNSNQLQTRNALGDANPLHRRAAATISRTNSLSPTDILANSNQLQSSTSPRLTTTIVLTGIATGRFGTWITSATTIRE